MKATALFAAVLLSASVTPAAFAQSTWNMTGGCTQQAANANTFGNSSVCVQDSGVAANATISAWSSSRGSNGTQFTLSGTGWANAFLSNNGGSGWGAVSRDEANSAGGLNVGSPNHSVDSVLPGTYDMVMVKFDQASILNQFGVGWGASDSDVTIMRWTGTNAPSTSNGTVVGGGSNKNLTDTIGAGGWELVSSFSDTCRNAANGLASNTSCDAAKSTWNIGTSNASSYWLISAFNTTMDPGNTWTTGNDGFKLNFLKSTAYSCPGGGTPNAGGGCTPSTGGNVPEPISLALFAVAALGAGTARRRALAKKD